MKILLLCVVTLMVVYGQEDDDVQLNYPEQECECGWFHSGQLEDDEPAIAFLMPEPVNCDDEGEMICSMACYTYAKTIDLHIPTLICNIIVDYEEGLPAALHKRVCDSAWVYLQLTSGREICCVNKTVVDCEYMN